MFGRLKKKIKTSSIDEIGIIIDRLEKIVSQTATHNDWEDLLSIQFDDKRAESLRLLFHGVSDAFPGEGMIMYSPAGMEILREILKALKSEREHKVS